MIQKDLGDLFQTASKDIFGGAFITVSGVRVSPDLGLARVYLSFFQTADKEVLLEKVNLYSKELRRQLANRVRNQVRKVPELVFFVDDSLDYAMHMEEVFKRLHDQEDDPQKP